MKKRRFAIPIALVLGAAVAVLVYPLALGAAGFRSQSSPADKVVAAGDKLAVAAPGADTPLLTAFMKTSKPTDLVLNVSLECSIITTVQNVGTSIATARGQVRVWVEVDNQIVPVQSVSSPPQNTPPGGDDTDKAVFCERVHTVNYMPDSQNETITQYQLTKNANAFNWLRLNVGAGSHTIVVKADLSASPAMGATNAEAIVGNRTLVVTPTKMANDAVINNPATG